MPHIYVNDIILIFTIVMSLHFAKDLKNVRHFTSLEDASAVQKDIIHIIYFFSKITEILSQILCIFYVVQFYYKND